MPQRRDESKALAASCEAGQSSGSPSMGLPQGRRAVLFAEVARVPHTPAGNLPRPASTVRSRRLERWSGYKLMVAHAWH